MPRPRVALLCSLLAAAGFGLGFLIARDRYAPPPARARVATAAAPASELAEAIAQALTDSDRLRGTEALAAQLQRAGPGDLADVRAGFESVFLDVADVEVVLLAEWWAGFDPSAAFAWAQQTRIANSEMVLRAAVRAWARRDPDAALEAVGRVYDPIARRTCLDAVVSGWDESGKPGLAVYLRDMPPSVEQLRSLTALVRRRVLREGPEATFRWAEALPEDGPETANRFKLQIFRRVVSEAGNADPQRTAAWAAQHSDGPNGDGLIGRAGIAWSLRDPQAALAWLSTIPPGSQRDRGVEETYGFWLGRDREHAMAWLREAKLEPWLDPAVASYAISSAQTDPESAVTWLERVGDGGLRRVATVAVGRTWLQQAPEAAQDWMKGLPEDLRQEISKPPPEQQHAGGAAAAAEPSPAAP